MSKIAKVLFGFLLLSLLSSTSAWPAEQYDVVVIGAGGGGLGAAATLAKAGMKVLVLEQHSKVGGYMTNFKRGPYTFESSVHYVGGLDETYGTSRAQWKELGLLDRVKLTPIKNNFRMVMPGVDFVSPQDLAANKKIYLSMFPDQAEGIDHIYDAAEHLVDAMLIMKARADGQTLRSYYLMATHPLFFWPMYKYKDMSAAELFADMGIKDPKLIFLLGLNTSNLPPEKSPAIVPLFTASVGVLGYHYPEGGTQVVSNALADIIRENKGEIKLSTLATKIVIENGRAVAVQTKDGAEHKCRYVVSNANALDTFHKLVGDEYLPKDFLAKLDSYRIGGPVFKVYLGVDHDYRKDCQAYNIMYFETDDLAQEMKLGETGDPEKAGFWLTNYSIVDPLAAPEGKNVIAIIAYLPYDWQNGWHEKEDYEKYRELKQEVADILVKRAEKILPGLSSHIELMEIASPRTFEHYTLNTNGSWSGWSLDKDNKVDISNQTPVDNLFLAGDWAGGIGVTGAIGSGVAAAKLIRDKDKQLAK